MSKKRILLYTRPITPPWDEASKNLAYDIATNISKNQFRVSLLTPQKSAFNQKLVKEYPHIKPEEIYRSANLDFKEKFQLLSRLFRPKLKTDLIHFLFTPRSITSFLIRLRLRFSKVKTLQTVATLSKKNLESTRKLNKILFADLIIVQSKNTFRQLKDKSIQKIKLIYPGINFKKYKPTQKDPGTLKKLKLKKTDFVVLYTGEYTRLKATDDILEALRILFKNYPNVDNLKLIFACRIKSKKDRVKKTAVIKTLKKESLFSKVIFLDVFDPMEKLYNLSDLNIFPVREMAGKFDIPLTLVESMACGKPIIVSRLRNLKELVGNNVRGLTCKKECPRDLAQKIHLLKTDKKLYNKIAESALIFVKSNFDIKEKAQEYNNIYKDLTK
ncbi:MAG: glycosyltransferase family 4 protein [Candidatus Moranbacteria bacterium]|nr:glycosyltransferase family 4 protein [Candidatus Moranbacteria bacterium]